MTDREHRILLIGYGNPGRQDDALGVMLADELQRWKEEQKLDCLYTDSNYQLNLEDAATLSAFDMAVFADASHEKCRHFKIMPLKPSAKTEFTMHAVSPAYVLHICQEVYGRMPEAYLLHIKGYAWEFMGSLTEKAAVNLKLATEFMKQFILDYRRRQMTGTSNMT